ncbi:MAG: winged helix-turn-helix domain-containing protein [Vicingaceae bacterium]
MRIIDPASASEEWIAISSQSAALDLNAKKSEQDFELLYLVLFALVIGMFMAYEVYRRSQKKRLHLISIGTYLFDQKNMALLKGEERQELTGKENDLLQLLYNHLNSTVDRDIILKEVWRDEGAYIGRTLDVYISKLRKKFETDPSINIINVRGVGYKLTLE